MDHFWRQGPLFTRDLLNSYHDPRPSFNTLASQVRTLEQDGFLKRELLGNAYRYSPISSEKEYGRKTISGTIEDFFNNSYLDVIHSLVKEERISRNIPLPGSIIYILQWNRVPCAWVPL